MSKIETGNDEKIIANILAFAAKAIEVCKKPGIDYTFECPLCGGEAHAGMAPNNGHRSGMCRSCGQSFIE